MRRSLSPILPVLCGACSVLLLLALAACQHSSPTQSQTSTAQNNTPSNAANPGTASDGAPVQSAPAPAASQAPPPPPPPQTITLTVPRGTSVAVRVNEALSSKDTDVGQTFTGTLYAPLRGSGGQVAFARGTRVSGEVVASKNRGRFKGEGILALELHRIGDRAVNTEEYVVTEKGKGKRAAGLIGGGAGAGGLIGGLAGGGKGGLIGALAGAGAGTAGAALTGNKPVELPAESKVRFSLKSAVKVVVPASAPGSGAPPGAAPGQR